MDLDDGRTPQGPVSATPISLPQRVVSAVVRHVKTICTVIAIAAVIAYGGVSFYAADVLTHGSHKPVDADVATSIGLHDDVAFPSRDPGLTLKGWLFHAPQPNGRSAILVHGWQDNRAGAPDRDLAKDLVAHGYDVLLFDLRSCGESDGDRFTLATREPQDLLGAYDFMRSQGERPQRMVIEGFSMGASTTIEAASQMPDVAALVEDSGFAELHPILEAQIPSRSHLPGIFNFGIEQAAALFDGADPNLKPVDMVRALPDRAWLIIVGGNDTFIPPANGDELRRASENPQTVELTIPGAEHVKALPTNPKLYLSTFYRFVDQQIAARGG